MRDDNMTTTWLDQVRSDPEATDVRIKVATAITECLPPDGKYGVIGGGNVFADEFLFQVADDVPDVKAVGQAIRWLEGRHLDVAEYVVGIRNSVLVCRPMVWR
jgi:hypothetical protein